MNPHRSMPPAVETYFTSANKSRLEAFTSAFDKDALILDNHREIKGMEAIKSWCEAEILEPNVTFEIVDMDDINNTIVVIAKVDGDFDKSNLPDPLLLKHQFLVNNNKIKELIITLP
ncbi:nuclear transport factor 2 family protein [Paenibacillus sp. LX16]|uniref:nuclear transport factor 2 family protein n=1 Tax=Paenibacillus sp. LX16 TaxID=1740264 RepID=UPI001A0FE742|nr:nuclear transport factor 2 family protein [Paenibacillus sp. LX16]KAF6631634.1 nuclear transport factor 2 family protein [Paenibacillus sp. EKM208P]